MLEILPKPIDRDVLDLLRCPDCGGDLAWQAGACECARGHRFPVRGGVPRFRPLDTPPSRPPTREDIKSMFLEDGSDRQPSVRLLAAEFGLGQGDVEKTRIFEVSAGAGRFTAALAAWGATVVAIERGACVDFAHRHLLDRRRVLVLDCREDLPLAEASFDWILCSDGLRSWPDPGKLMMQLPALLAPGGEIVIRCGGEQEGMLAVYRGLARSTPAARWRQWGKSFRRWLKADATRLRRARSRLPADLAAGGEDGIIRALEAVKYGASAMRSDAVEQALDRSGVAIEIERSRWKQVPQEGS